MLRILVDRHRLDLLLITGAFVAYSVTIHLALQADAIGSALGGLANIVPLVVFGAAARWAIRKALIGRPLGIQLGGHLLLCAAFSICAYALLIVILGFVYGRHTTGFLVEPFSESAAAWQTLENVTTYAVIALVSYLQASQATTAFAPRIDPMPTAADADADAKPLPSAAGNTPGRYFVRVGEELRPLDLNSVVSIGGADDYSEVVTDSARHLVRVTLSEFTRTLDPEKYARVHRSWIVNIDRIVRAEPAGAGRLHLHMATGQIVSTSRAGAKLLRDRII